MSEFAAPFVPVIIVSFRNARDVQSCIRALARLRTVVTPRLFLCENGGHDAFRGLVTALAELSSKSADTDEHCDIRTSQFTETASLQAARPDGAAPLTIYVGCAAENLGYAGGVNAWLRPLASLDGWAGAWILNPDTEPEPDALQELIAFAAKNDRGMVGSRLTSRSRPDLVHCRGLAWDKVRASTRSVDMFSSADICLSPSEQDSRLDAPSGASIYVTRTCSCLIGLMDERYFLYFEDLDWGIRAKERCGVGYAHRSVVVHVGGTTIGTATSRRHQSSLAIYLDFRNRLLFARAHFPAWFPWTVLVAFADLILYLRLGRVRATFAAMRGLCAGLAGTAGRPDAMVRAHLAESANRNHEADS